MTWNALDPGLILANVCCTVVYGKVLWNSLLFQHKFLDELEHYE